MMVDSVVFVGVVDNFEIYVGVGDNACGTFIVLSVGNEVFIAIVGLVFSL